VLESAIAANPDDAMAILSRQLLYDKKRYADAIRHWESVTGANGAFATVHRKPGTRLLQCIEQPGGVIFSRESVCCNSGDARVLYDWISSTRSWDMLPETRLTNLESHWELVTARDDLYLEYIRLLNTLKHLRKSDRLCCPNANSIRGRAVKAKVTGQYVFAHVELGKRYLRNQQDKEAIETIEERWTYPENLSEGKLAGAQENNIHYYLGWCI